MKLSTVYSFLLFLVLAGLHAQSRQLSLAKGNTQLFRGAIYCYGFLSQSQKATFCIYKLDSKLKITDSLVLAPGRDLLDTYLRISSDTLHDFLNVYLQKKEKKLVTVLRFNKKMELIANIDNIDVARLNSISAFESELLYAGKYAYTVKSQKDSSGLQFYLNKFSLKSEQKNFDYEFTWQFAFERQNIQSAHVFYANRQVVMLYVHVNDGPKAGQWILSIQASTGKLIRGTRLNDKGEDNTYQFGQFIADSVKRTLTLAGQKFTEAQLKPKENKLAISNAPFLNLYLVEIDSLGEILLKQDFKIPVNDAKTNSKKTTSNYIFRISRLTKDREGKISVEADLFRNGDNSLSFLYANTQLLTLSPSDDVYLAEKSVAAANPLIEKYYYSKDKSDRNGKLATDSLASFETLFYKPVNFPVKQSFKMDADRNPVWILKRSDPKKNTINYTLLSPVKKAYQLTTLEEINTLNNPACLVLDNTTFLITRQVEDTTYQLKLYNW